MPRNPAGRYARMDKIFWRNRYTRDSACLRGLFRYGLTQREIAKEIGRSPTLVSLWATGKRNPSETDIQALDRLVLTYSTKRIT